MARPALPTFLPPAPTPSQACRALPSVGSGPWAGRRPSQSAKDCGCHGHSASPLHTPLRPLWSSTRHPVHSQSLPFPTRLCKQGEDCPSTACPERRRLSSPSLSGGHTSCWEVAPGPSSGSPSYRVARTSTEGMQQLLLPPQGGAALPPPSNAGQALSPQGTGTLSTPSRVAYLGMGWDVGTTGTNLGQLAICSWTFMQEEMCTLILASVTWEERGGGWGSVEAKASGCRGRGNDQQAGQVPGGLSQGLRVPAREETLREGDTGQDPEGPPSSVQQQVLTASRCGSAGGRRPATSPGQEHALVGPSGSCRRAGTVHGGPGRAFIPS